MAEENEIRVVITGVASDLRRALDGAKGDLGGLKAAIKDVPNQVKVDVQAQTAIAAARLTELRDLAKAVPDRINIQADADTGVASAKLRLLKAQARDTEESIARTQLGGLLSGGGGSSGGSGLLSSLTSGGLPGASQLGLLTAAAPGVAALAGSLTALAGSAGAAALGIGALGTAGVGVFAAGVGPLAILSGGLKDAVTLSGQLTTAQQNLASAQKQYGGQNTALTTAQNNYNAAVAAFGPGSATAIAAHQQLLLAQQKQATVAPQITSAQNALNKLMTQADPATLAFAKSLQKVSSTLDDAEQRILPAFARALTPVLNTFTGLLPTIEQMARIDLSGLTAWLKPVLDFVNSASFKAALLDLSRTFAQLGGPLGDAFANLMRAFLNVAVAAAPFLVQIADAFDSWTKSFAASLAPGQGLTDLIGGLVGQLHSWWDLAKALGGVMVTIFSAGAGQGQSLVNQLTQILDKWNAWLNTSAGQEALKKFFTDSVNLIKGIASVLAPVIKLIAEVAVGLIPVMTKVLAPLAGALAAIAGFVEGLANDLPGVLKVLPGLAVAIGVLASWKALQALVSSTVSAISGKITGGVGTAAGEAGTVAPGAAAEKGAGAGISAGRVLSGLGIAAIGTTIAQEIGSSIHGAVGKAVADIGTGASIGGGLGSIFGPWGAAAGAALGAGIGGAVDLFQSRAKSDGEKWATAFTSSLPGHVSDSVTKGLTDALNHAKNLQNLTAPPGQIPTGAPNATPSAPHATRGGSVPVDPNLAKDTADAFRAAGVKAGQAFIDGEKSVKFPSTAQMFGAISTGLDALPVQARAAAAQTMLAYAQSLQEQGKLPKGAVATLIKDIETEFPALTVSLDKASAGTAAAVAANLKMTDAVRNTQDAVQRIKDEFGKNLFPGVKVTSGQLLSSVTATFGDLRDAMSSMTHAGRVKALAELAALRDTAIQDATAMGTKVTSQILSMKDSIVSGVASAVTQASGSFAAFATNIFAAMSAGTLATAKGVRIIADALNAALKAFGEKPLGLTTIAGATPAQLGAVASGQVSSGGLASPHAAGGLIQVGRPGDKGADTIPLNVGGTPITVGAGEQVAVFNDHQQAVMNTRLADMGGLSGMFSKHNRRHGFATGGIVPSRYAAGGNVWEVRASQEEASSGTGWTELSPNGNAAARLGIPHSFSNNPGHYPDFASLGQFFPNGTLALKIRGPRGSGVWNKTDSGDGSSFAPAIGLTPAVSGVTGGTGGTVQITRADGGDLHPFPGMARLIAGTGGFAAAGAAGAAAAIQKLVAPTVKGGGTVGEIVKGGLGLATDAANKYLQAHQPAPSVAGGGSVGPTGPVPKSVAEDISRSGTVADPSGYPVAGWIEPILNWARQHGAVFTVSSGWRSDAAQKAIYDSGTRPAAVPISEGGKGSNHEFTKYPGGAVDVSPGAESLNVALLRGPYASILEYAGAKDPVHFSHPHDGGYAKGGLVRMAAGGFVPGLAPGGLVSSAASTTKPKTLKTPKPKTKTVKPTKTVKGLKLGKFTPPAGLDASQFSQIAALNTRLSDLGGWQTYLDGLHGSTGTVEALVTLADGSQVVNLDGMTDPSSGEHVKGITQRLAEIGQPGTRDINTELGVEDQILDAYLGQQTLAGKVGGDLGPWLKAMGADQEAWSFVSASDDQQSNWLTAMLSENVPFSQITIPEQESTGLKYKPMAGHPRAQLQTGPGGANWYEWISGYLRAVKNAIAMIARNTQLQEQMPAQRTQQDAAITDRFEAARHAISNASATATYDSSSLLATQQQKLADERRAALAGVPSVQPASWKGDSAGWTAQASTERSAINSEFDQRAAGLRSASSSTRFQGRVSQSNALYGLGVAERGEKTALSLKLEAETKTLSDDKRSESATKSNDTSYLRRLLANLKVKSTGDARYLAADTAQLAAVTDQGGFADQLKGYLDPLGALSIDIATEENINIPRYLAEISDLTGTTAVPAPVDPNAAGASGSSGPDLTALNALLTQQLQATQQALAVSQAQFGVFQGFEPLLAGRLLGSFATGIDRVPQTGPYLLHKDEMVVPDPGGPFGNRAASVQTAQGPVEVTIVMGNDEQPLMKIISATMNKQALSIVSQQSGQRSRLMAGVRRP